MSIEANRTTNIGLKIIAIHNETERLTSKTARVNHVEINRSIANVEKWSAERQETVEKTVKATEVRDIWGTLSNIAQYVGGIGSIALGVACGGLPGVALIAGGVLGIGNRVLNDTHVLQAAVEWYTGSEELQKKILHNIEMGSFFLQLGLGLAGGVGAWHAGTFAAAKALGATETAVALLSPTTQLGVKFYDKKLADLRSRRKELDQEILLSQQAMLQDIQQTGMSIDDQQPLTEVCRTAIRNLQVSSD